MKMLDTKSTMSQFRWINEHMKDGLEHRRELRTLQKEIGQLKRLLNMEKIKAQSEREWRIQACNDLLVNQQQLEEEKSRNEKLIMSETRAGGPMHQILMTHRISKTTSSMEVVIEQQAEKENNKDPQKGQKRQTPLNKIKSPEDHIDTVNQQKEEESNNCRQLFLSNDESEESCPDKRFIWKNARKYLHWGNQRGTPSQRDYFQQESLCEYLYIKYYTQINPAIAMYVRDRVTQTHCSLL